MERERLCEMGREEKKGRATAEEEKSAVAFSSEVAIRKQSPLFRVVIVSFACCCSLLVHAAYIGLSFPSQEVNDISIGMH